MREPSKFRESSIYGFDGMLNNNVVAKDDEEVTKWTYREINWYLAENRLLFATNDKLEICKWNLVFKWLLQKNI